MMAGDRNDAESGEFIIVFITRKIISDDFIVRCYYSSNMKRLIDIGKLKIN